MLIVLGISCLPRCCVPRTRDCYPSILAAAAAPVKLTFGPLSCRDAGLQPGGPRAHALLRFAPAQARVSQYQVPRLNWRDATGLEPVPTPAAPVQLLTREPNALFAVVIVAGRAFVET